MNVARCFLDALDHFGEYPCCFHQGVWSTNTAQIAFAERLATVLQEVGVARGDRVALMMPSEPAVIAAFHAIWRLGALVVPVPPQWTAGEARYVLAHSGAQVVLTVPELAARVADAAAGVPGFRSLLVFGPTSDPRTTDVLERIRTASRCGPVVDWPDEQLAMLVYTSGTTERPKAVMLSHGNLWTNVRAAVDLAQNKTGQTTLHVLPLSHVFGVHCMIYDAICGSRSIILSRWDTREVLETIQRFRVQRFAAVPTMLSYLIGSPDRDAYDCSSLEFVSVGGASTPDEVRRRFEQLFGCRVKDGYGCTEATCSITGYSDDEPHRAGSVGRPIAQMELRICDAQGVPMPPGGEGEICLRGPHVMQGYWHDEAATRAVLRDGWLHTGDWGRLDADGYVHVLGREKELIIKAGENISPREIEDAVHRHPDVAEAAVVGLPDPLFGEEIALVVVLRPGGAASAADLRAHLSRHLAKFKVPAYIFFRTELPKTASGKTLRRALREEYGARVEF